MKHIRKFNESNDENILMIEDVFSGLSDDWDVNISVMTIPSKNEFILSEMISKIDHIILKPSYIKSMMDESWKEHAINLPPGHVIFKNTKLIKKYLKCKIYQVSISGIKDNPKGVIDGSKLISEIDKYSDIVESYGLLKIGIIDENIGPKIVIFSTYPTSDI